MGRTHWRRHGRPRSPASFSRPLAFMAHACAWKSFRRSMHARQVKHSRCHARPPRRSGMRVKQLPSRADRKANSGIAATNSALPVASQAWLARGEIGQEQEVRQNLKIRRPGDSMDIFVCQRTLRACAGGLAWRSPERPRGKRGMCRNGGQAGYGAQDIVYPCTPSPKSPRWVEQIFPLPRLPVGARRGSPARFAPFPNPAAAICSRHQP